MEVRQRIESSPSSDMAPTNLRKVRLLQVFNEIINQLETQLSESRSDWLLYAKVTEVPHRDCVKNYDKIKDSRYDTPDGLRQNQLCALGKVAASGYASDSCQGDSGGSLFFEDKQIVNESYRLAGVVSFGVGCGSPDYASVYTRVASYIEWIEDIVWLQ